MTPATTGGDPWAGKFSFDRIERPVTIPAWMDRDAAMRALAEVRAKSERRWKDKP